MKEAGNWDSKINFGYDLSVQQSLVRLKIEIYGPQMNLQTENNFTYQEAVPFLSFEASL